jgi:glycosyltransferase involved in cell wall biosynthesis
VPHFSIVVPAYEAASTLAETLDAVLAQAFADWECIVVDDGSTDNTLSIASAYAREQSRIRVVHQQNEGTAGAYNTGVASATGEFIVVCSADDVLLPDHLARMSAFIESESGYDIYSSNGYFWWPGDGRTLFYESGQHDEIQSLELADVIRECFFSVGAVYRRDLFATVGGYRLGVYGEDYDFWLRAIASGARHRYLPEPLALHRMSPSQKSADLETVHRSNIRLISDLRRDFHLSAAHERAALDGIRERERLLAELNQPSRIVRRPVERVAVRLLGHPRARRVYRALKSMIGRGAPR